jgi:uncharacterized protein with HEPN domain
MAATKSPRARLLHIRDEIEGIAQSVRGLTFEQYRESYMHRRTVERGLQIISEAARSLPAELHRMHADAPWKSILGLGNMLRHEYQHLDDKQLWEIVSVHLPKLQPVISRMIEELEQSCPKT